jgi:hypothetical protein
MQAVDRVSWSRIVSLHQQKELVGELLGVAQTRVAGELGNLVLNLPLVSQGDLMAGMVAVRELGGCALEGAAQALGAGRQLLDRPNMPTSFSSGSARWATAPSSHSQY